MSPPLLPAVFIKTIDKDDFPWYLLLFDSGEGEALAVISSESRMQGTVRRVTMASALSNAEGTLGAWAMSLQGFLAEVCVCMRSMHPLPSCLMADRRIGIWVTARAVSMFLQISALG